MNKRTQTHGFIRHPLSQAWGDMPDQEVMALAEDIAKNGQKDSVVMFEGMVLDGWHRCQACQIAGVPVRVIDFPEGGDPYAYVTSKNNFRRHSSASMRAAAALKVAEMRPRGNPNFPTNEKTENPSKNAGSDKGATLPHREEKSRGLEDLAKEAGVSKRTMKDANAAKKAGLLDDVATGKKSASAAAKEARAKDGKGKEKPPSPTDKLKAELAQAKEQIAYLEESIDNLKDEIDLKSWAELDKNEQVQELERLQRQVRTLESQRDEYQNEANQWKREALALRRKVAA